MPILKWQVDAAKGRKGEDSTNIAFRLFDIDQDGFITKEEFAQVIAVKGDTAECKIFAIHSGYMSFCHSMKIDKTGKAFQ